MFDHDLKCLENAIKAANSARKNGNHPFGAVLTDASGEISFELRTPWSPPAISQPMLNSTW